MSSTALEAGPSSPKSDTPQAAGHTCAHCSQTAKYTCPRCGTRTCSLVCSRTHKASIRCSGERDKAKYIPMNQYEYGQLMSDYVFLEDVGRRIGEWGREIVDGNYMAARGLGQRGKRGSSRGGSSRGGRGYPNRDRGRREKKASGKREALQAALEKYDIEMEFLPAGMDKRALNQSTWDHKKQAVYLTLELVLHPPPYAGDEKCVTLLTQRNDASQPLLSLLQKAVKERAKSKKEPAAPEWLCPLVLPPSLLQDPGPSEAKLEDAQFIPPLCYITASPTALSRPSSQKIFHTVDPSQPLLASLKFTTFVEFPSLHVYDPQLPPPGDVVDAKGVVTIYADIEQERYDEERKAKRRRLDGHEGRKKIGSLLGDYGSEDSEDSAEGQSNGLSGLGAYGGSDEESEGDEKSDDGGMAPEVAVIDAKVEGGDTNGTGEISDDDGEGDVPLDPNVLLDLIKQSRAIQEAVDEDMVDWDAGSGDDEIE